MKRTSVLAVLALGTVALAANNVVGANGLGAHVSATGMRWCFALDGKKTYNGTTPTFSGPTRFRREVVENGHKMVNDIYMGKPDELVKQLNVATYAGPARRRLTRDGVLVREDAGRLWVKATDRRVAGATGELDLLEWKFTATGLPTLGNSGPVTSGDLVVYERPL